MQRVQPGMQRCQCAVTVTQHALVLPAAVPARLFPLAPCSIFFGAVEKTQVCVRPNVQYKGCCVIRCTGKAPLRSVEVLS